MCKSGKSSMWLGFCKHYQVFHLPAPFLDLSTDALLAVICNTQRNSQMDSSLIWTMRSVSSNFSRAFALKSGLTMADDLLAFGKYPKWGVYSQLFQEKIPRTVPPAEASSAYQTCMELLAHFIIRGAMARAYRAIASGSTWVVLSSEIRVWPWMKSFGWLQHVSITAGAMDGQLRRMFYEAN